MKDIYTLLTLSVLCNVITIAVIALLYSSFKKLKKQYLNLASKHCILKENQSSYAFDEEDIERMNIKETSKQALRYALKEEVE